MINTNLTPFQTSTHPTTITHLESSSGSATIELDTTESHHILIVEGNSDINITYTTTKPGVSTVVKCLCLATSGHHIKLMMNGQVQHDHTAVDLHVVTLYADGGSAQIDGKVSLLPGGVKMHGELLEENIILGAHATIKTLPMLDVKTNDVTAAHGARIERLDEKKIFYLKSRGLDDQAATQMMIHGYIESIFEGVEDSDEVEALKSRAFELVA